MIDINALPYEEKSIEILNRDRLNFRAQPVDCEPVDPRQQPAIAPFLLRSIRMKFAAQNKPSASRPSNAASISEHDNSKMSASSSAVTGPQTSIRPRTSSRIAS